VQLREATATMSDQDVLGAYSFLPLNIVPHDELGLGHLSSASRCLELA
jgi:hypothetical protein